MIFGFNTDVKHGETVYHVQSEARQNDLLLQTQVFVKGQCVAKRTASFAALVAQAGFSEEQMQELLRQQHGNVVEAVRAGAVSELGGIDAAIEDVGGGLSLRWLNADAAPQNGEARLRIAVTDHGASIAGARVIVHPIGGDLLQESEGITGSDGIADTTVAIDFADTREVGVIVTATHGERSGTRKFRLKRP